MNADTVELTKESFKLIKSFYPDFQRAPHNSNRYFIDWNGLMPVVHKILKTTYPPNGQGWPYVYTQLKAARVGNSLWVINDKVLDFIKWYNEVSLKQNQSS